MWLVVDRSSALSSLGIALSIWLFLATFIELASRIKLFQVPLMDSVRSIIRQPRASWGMTFAHMGLAIAVAGITASSTWKVESIQVMKFGDQVTVAGYTYTLNDVKKVQGPNYIATRGVFNVKKGASFNITLEPEKREYQTRTMVTTEAAIYSTFFGDLYAVVGDLDKNSGGYITRIYFNPLVPWMWAGAILMVLGAAISLTDRRHRVGAPAVNTNIITRQAIAK